MFYHQTQTFGDQCFLHVSWSQARPSLGVCQESVHDGFGSGHRGHLSRPEDQGGLEDDVVVDGKS